MFEKARKNCTSEKLHIAQVKEITAVGSEVGFFFVCLFVVDFSPKLGNSQIYNGKTTREATFLQVTLVVNQLEESYVVV